MSFKTKIGKNALRRVLIGRAALVAAAICVATAPSPSWAATWNGVSSGFTSDGGNWIGGAAPTSGNVLLFTNTTERTLYVTNDISDKLNDTTVANGSWEFASTQTLQPGNALLVGNSGQTVGIVNYGVLGGIRNAGSLNAA